MNGLLLALIVYMIGWAIALVCTVWKLRDEPELHNEPGVDEATIIFFTFLWPIALAIIATTRDRKLRSQ